MTRTNKKPPQAPVQDRANVNDALQQRWAKRKLKEDLDLLEEAISWLYDEEVTPRALVLQWRLQWMCGEKWNSQRLLAAVKASNTLHVEPPTPSKMNFGIFRQKDDVNSERIFSDSEETAYAVPDALWTEVAKEMEVGGWLTATETAFQSFEIATWLQGLFPDSTVGLLLGLAHRGLRERVLGYKGALLVPYAKSDTQEKAENARQFLPTAIQDGEMYVDDWEHLRWCLAQVLKGTQNEIHLSALKVKFREKFRAELSETAFGHTTLMGLLSDERLGSDFVVERESNLSNSILKLTDDKLAKMSFVAEALQ
eukprot:CAMPEP_0178421868 /NCGR_PEP_ID=MMETSP0689_2-20121128/26873_1 /TAXON_ID=160604 /ORGANISM="Amphidinium massartii, Strain CS-259" /LENGTH=310 /DNA_ID=CAMNT_0020043401 /DNA_START=55 /DNA_END=988 /DNA_ORIENTATION=+